MNCRQIWEGLNRAIRNYFRYAKRPDGLFYANEDDPGPDCHEHTLLISKIEQSGPGWHVISEERAPRSDKQ